MSNETWSWWVGHDEERYHTECETREEAVQIARDEYEGGWIIEATQEPDIQLSDYFEIDDFLDRAEDRAFDNHGDPEGDQTIFDLSKEDQSSLEEQVRKAIREWQDNAGIVFSGWRFTASRNSEYVPGLDEDASGEDT